MSSSARGPRELQRRKKLIYGAGELFNSTTTVIILMLYLKFLTDVAGLTPILAGVCVVAGKLWDAFSDPLIGSISDRTRSRHGRRRIYFAVFAIPSALSFTAMWLTFDTTSQALTVIYYALAYVVFKTLATLLNVPYQALGPELVRGYDERTALVSFRMAFSLGGSILAGVVPNLIIEKFARAGAAQTGHLIVAALFGGVCALIWLLLFAAIREPAREEEPSGQQPRVPFWRSLKTASKNRAFRVLVGIYLCAFLAVDTLTAAAKFYVEEFLADPAMMPVVMGTMLGCALLSLPVYFRLVSATSRKTAFAIGASIWIAGLMILLFFVDRTSARFIIVAALVLVGVGLASAFVVPWSALPEVLDLDRLVTGRKNEGVYTGVMTFLRKLTTTLALFGISLSLDLTGYVPALDEGSRQNDTVLLAIRLITTSAPAVFLVIAVIFALRYPIDKRTHALMLKKLTPGSPRLSPEEQRDWDKFKKSAYADNP